MLRKIDAMHSLYGVRQKMIDGRQCSDLNSEIVRHEVIENAAM